MWNYFRGKVIPWKRVFPALITGLIGGGLGAYLSRYLSNKFMVYLLLMAIPLIFFLSSKLKKVRQQKAATEIFYGRAALIGLVMGFYDGFFGPGTGVFLLISFVLFLKFSYVEAGAGGRVLNLITNLSALILFIFRGRILWNVAAIGIAGSLLGNFIGSRLALAKAEKIIRPVFYLVLALLLIKSLNDVLALS